MGGLEENPKSGSSWADLVASILKETSDPETESLFREWWSPSWASAGKQVN